MTDTLIKLRRSAVPGKTPTDEQMQLGEVAINTYDGKMFFKQSSTSNSILQVATTIAPTLTNLTLLGTLTANSSVGSVGQVLVSSGTGVYWGDVVGGGGGSNLSYSANSVAVSIFSDTGTDVVLAAANTTIAGVLTSEAQTIGGIKTFANDSIFNGNVGVGVSPTSSRMHIQASTVGDGGTLNGSGSVLYVKQDNTWSANNQWALYVSGYSYLNGFRINAADGIRALYKTNSGGQLGFATSGDDPITFTQSNTLERMRIDTGGNVGINNTAPTAKLDVHGTVRFTNSTTNTKVAGPTYNYNWFNNNSVVQSYKIATLPISSGSTLEHIVLEGVLGGWISTDKNNFKLSAANRGSLTVNYQSGTGYSTRPPQAHVDFYTEADGSVSVWVVLDATTYSIASVNITVAYGTPELLTYPNPTSATPTGTLSYSTKTGIPTIYTTNSSQIGIGMTAPVAKLDIGGTSAGLPSARFATNAGGGSVQNAAGLSAYWNLSNGSSESTLAYGNSAISYFSMGEHNGTAYTERLRITNTGSLGIGTTAPINKLDVAGNASLRNSTTATNFYTHNTYTDASNYERAKIGWNTNVLEIGSEALGTGAVRNINLIGGNVGIGAASPSAKLDVVGDIKVNSNVNLHSEATTLATTTKTQISSFAVASFRSGKLIVQAYDSVTGEVQISELLVAHNGTTASATEYGVVYTGAASLVSYDVDISAGNVRLLATRTTANSTQYKISKTLIIA